MFAGKYFIGHIQLDKSDQQRNVVTLSKLYSFSCFDHILLCPTKKSAKVLYAWDSTVLHRCLHLQIFQISGGNSHWR